MKFRSNTQESHTHKELRCKNVISNVSTDKRSSSGYNDKHCGSLVYIVSKDTQVSVIMAGCGLISSVHLQIKDWGVFQDKQFMESG